MKIRIISITALLLLAIFSCKSDEEEVMVSREKKGDDLRGRLTELQYRVTQEKGTEPAFNNEYWDNKEPGIYVDIVTGEPLFSSLDKYDSRSGWPSFTKPLVDKNIVESVDKSHFMVRTEVSSSGGSHLGHLFDDGPQPTGLRYCINSASLRFIPVGDLVMEGYGDYLALFDESLVKYQYANFAAGCFWGVEHILKDIEGVLETTVGYSGGETDYPTYREVSTGQTGHAEAVLIKFDPALVSYEELVGYFWRLHDPTQLNRQGPDRGTQYRSAIFYYSEEQRDIALRSKEKFDQSGVFDKPAVTQIVKAGRFYDGEEYHQDYFDKNQGYSCHVLRER